MARWRTDVVPDPLICAMGHVLAQKSPPAIGATRTGKSAKQNLQIRWGMISEAVYVMYLAVYIGLEFCKTCPIWTSDQNRSGALMNDTR